MPSLPSRSHNGSVVEASDDADAVDRSYFRRVFVDIAIDFNVDVAMVEVVVVDDVVLVGVAAVVGGQNWHDYYIWTELRSWKRHLLDVRGCIPGPTFCTLRGSSRRCFAP